MSLVAVTVFQRKGLVTEIRHRGGGWRATVRMERPFRAGRMALWPALWFARRELLGKGAP